MWDLATGTSTPLEGHTGSVNSASFSPSGDRIVTASDDGSARVWDLATGTSISLEGHSDRVTTASFSPSGDRVVTASDDGTARVWDLTTGTSIPLEGHLGRVTTASFSPSGDRVFTTSWWDRTARVWDLQGRQLAIYKGSPATISPNEHQLATVVYDIRVQVHDIETLPELLTWGCQWLHNYLEYGQATDADRAICNLPPRSPDPAGPFESSLGRAVGLVGVSWPERSEGVDG